MSDETAFEQPDWSVLLGTDVMSTFVRAQDAHRALIGYVEHRQGCTRCLDHFPACDRGRELFLDWARAQGAVTGEYAERWLRNAR